MRSVCSEIFTLWKSPHSKLSSYQPPTGSKKKRHLYILVCASMGGIHHILISECTSEELYIVHSVHIYWFMDPYNYSWLACGVSFNFTVNNHIIFTLFSTLQFLFTFWNYWYFKIQIYSRYITKGNSGHIYIYIYKKKKKNSVALVRERTIPTDIYKQNINKV